MREVARVAAVALQFVGVALGGWYFYQVWVGIPAPFFKTATAIGILAAIVFAAGAGLADAVL
jgi:hypothetical protein